MYRNIFEEGTTFKCSFPSRIVKLGDKPLYIDFTCRSIVHLYENGLVDPEISDQCCVIHPKLLMEH